MKKIGLEIDQNNQFLYAFCCTVKDYKLVWQLNKNTNFNYRKEKDIPFYSEELSKKIYFNQYKDDKNNNNTTIIYNKNKDGFLVSELKDFDFLFLFNWTPIKHKERLILELKKIKEYVFLQKITQKQILKFKNKYILACF